ncbi:MAG: protein serine/threonine phosphatase [Chloroflexi bacterium]|nr:protein serine/threonine phosphatase [Chloroflexota bacterium]
MYNGAYIAKGERWGDRSRMQLAAYALTDRGRRRSQNQDNVLCYTLQGSKTPVGLYAVADGMGGQSAGEIASQIAIDTVREELGQFLEHTVGATPAFGDDVVTGRLVENDEPTEAPNLSLVDLLSGAMQQCNHRIREHGLQNPDTAGLGSTLTVVMVTGDLALIGNIGDSRTYILRDGTIRSLTQDHSLVGSLVRQGLITEDDVYKHPHRNLIYNALGTRPDANPDIAMHRLQGGDILLLCSDGLWEMVRDEDIRAIVEELADPTEAATSLVDAANQNGGVDNISVVIVRVQ